VPIKKEFIHGGMKLIHPSGKITITDLKNLRYLKEQQERTLTFIQEQIAETDKNIKEVEKITGGAV